MKQAVREAAAAGVVAVVVACCAVVAGLAIFGALFVDSRVHSATVCLTRELPSEVRERATGEGPGSTSSTSLVPMGARCTWTLPDGSTVSADPSWDATLVVVGAAAVAVGALGLLARASRRSAAGTGRRR